MTTTGYKPRKYRSLKEMSYELVNRVGGFQSAASKCRVQSATLFRYTDDSDENTDRYMPVDIVEILESEAGSPIVTEYLAEKSNYLLWEIPDLDNSNLGLVVVETGERVSLLFKHWAEFLNNDGLIDRSEAKELLKDNVKLVRTLMRMRSDLESRISDSDESVEDV